jgi:hypothetical protein
MSSPLRLKGWAFNAKDEFICDRCDKPTGRHRCKTAISTSWVRPSKIYSMYCKPCWTIVQRLQTRRLNKLMPLRSQLEEPSASNPNEHFPKSLR